MALLDGCASIACIRRGCCARLVLALICIAKPSCLVYDQLTEAVKVAPDHQLEHLCH
jgi:hypothetical protein